MQLTKLTWRCRRGTQELDKLLLNYLEQNYLNAPLLEQLRFQQLLDLEDNQLLQLFFAEPSQNPNELNCLVEKIRRAATV